MELPTGPLTPHYELSGENCSAEVYTGPLELISQTEGPCVKGEGSIRLVTRPYQGYVFHFEGSVSLSTTLKDDFVGLVLPNGRSADITVTDMTRQLGGNGKLVLQGRLREFLLGNPCPVAVVEFHLLDFPKIADRGIRTENSVSLARGLGQALDWGVVVDGLPAKPGLDDSKLSHRPRISHVGRLLRTDGKPIEPDWASKRLETLRWFLSLLLGCWTGPHLVVGLHDGEEVWSSHRNFYVGNESMGSALIPALGHVSWEQYSTALARFDSLLKKEEWDRILKRAVTWYVEANTSTESATAVVLAQAGLELLCWARLVLCGGLGDGYDKLRAADAIRHILVLSGIQKSMPPSIHELILEQLDIDEQKQFKDSDYDGPTWLTAVRNSVVHPQPKLDVSNPGILQIAGILGRHYLELLLMNLLGYQGFIRNRTVDSWPIEQVPWSEAQLWPEVA